MSQYQELRSPPVFWPYLLYLDADASCGAGRHEEGLTAIDSAIAMVGGPPGNTLEPDMLRLKGDLLAGSAATAGGSRTAAEPWYRRALERANELGVRSTPLPAATRLARLLFADDEPQAARDLLRPVYATREEGMSTADLREAKDLLEAIEGDGRFSGAP